MFRTGFCAHQITLSCRRRAFRFKFPKHVRTGCSNTATRLLTRQLDYESGEPVTAALDRTTLGKEPHGAVSRGHRITNWNPEDDEFWANGGERIARRNMICSVFTEHFGFAVWTMWSTLILFLGPQYGLTPDQKFTLVSVPAAVGGLLRIPYSLAVARFGGRDWTIISASLLLLPTVPAMFLLKPGVSYHTLLMLVAVAGVGGGNFASSMSNINAFYPERAKGLALGINAAAGNLGVAVVQLLGLLVLATAGASHPRVLVGIF